MEKAKENWIGEHCSEIEENLRKNNIKRCMEKAKENWIGEQCREIEETQDR